MNNMKQPKKSIEEIKEIINQIKFKDRKIHIDLMGSTGCFIQVQYMEVCIDSGALQLQKARKWYVSFFSTETEIVETVFKAIRTSNDHVLKEHFTYKGRRVYSPHFDINARIHICDEWESDGRK